MRYEVALHGPIARKSPIYGFIAIPKKSPETIESPYWPREEGLRKRNANLMGLLIPRDLLWDALFPLETALRPFALNYQQNVARYRPLCRDRALGTLPGAAPGLCPFR